MSTATTWYESTGRGPMSYYTFRQYGGVWCLRRYPSLVRANYVSFEVPRNWWVL